MNIADSNGSRLSAPHALPPIVRRVQVNIPFTMLWDRYADVFIGNRLNPEIGIDAAALDRFSRRDFAAMADRLRENQVAVTLHGPFIDLSAGSVDPQIRRVTAARLGQVLELVPLFRPRTIVCHAGYDRRRYGFLQKAWLEHSIATWSEFGAALYDRGCRLMLENVYEEIPEEIAVLLEALAESHVGFCLDSGHQNAFSKAPLSRWLDVLGPTVGQLHLHDNRGARDEHTALGTGNIDFPMLLKHLRRIHPTPPVVTLEPHAEDSLRPSLNYLERHWPW
ncbi:MAG TPA: sugar phosphate isomerase/epimerase family protein [Desulfobacterales bacterium]